jgi:hypothetical protein
MQAIFDIEHLPLGQSCAELSSSEQSPSTRTIDRNRRTDRRPSAPQPGALANFRASPWRGVQAWALSQ